jgi:uncharacterized membrane protein YbhN (UPF0104 family)
MNKKIKYIFLALGFCFFAYLVADFGVEKIIINIQRTGWYFTGIIGTWLFVYLLNALAFRQMLNASSLSYRRILSVTIAGYALNYMTPFFHLGGEPYRVMALKKDIGLAKSLSATLSYLMLHFLSSFLFWFVAIISILLFLPVSAAGYGILGACLLVCVWAILMFVKGYKNGVITSLSKYIVKVPLFKRFSDSVEKKEDLLNEVNGNISDLILNRKKDFILSNVYELLSRFVATLEFYFILHAIGYSPTLLDSFLINAGASVISNLLFIVPFELGVKEGGLYVTLKLLHFVPELGIYVGLINRLRELVWILVGLVLIALMKDKITENKIESIAPDESNII